MVFVDENLDGVYQSGERPAEGIEVFVDVDGDAYHSEGEPTAVTDMSGHFELTRVPAGRYALRPKRTTGDWTASAHPVVVVEGDRRASVALGGVHVKTFPVDVALIDYARERIDAELFTVQDGKISVTIFAEHPALLRARLTALGFEEARSGAVYGDRLIGMFPVDRLGDLTPLAREGLRSVSPNYAAVVDGAGGR